MPPPRASSLRPPRIVVIGGANTDFLVRAARLPQPGETITGEEFDHAVAGGKGANQAVAAARLGARVTFLGRVGADERGEALLRQLGGECVDVVHVARDRHAPTGIALISVDARGEKQIVVAPGANDRFSRADVQRAAPILQGADVLILQFEVPMKANLAAARLAHRAGVPIVLDPAPAVAHVSADFLHHITVVRANEFEAEALTGVKVKDRASATAAAMCLLGQGPRVAIISVNSGNLAVWRELSRKGRAGIDQPSEAKLGELWLPRLQVKTIDATGAGDAFAAALAVALAEGQPVPAAASFANAAAALATTKLGAQEALPSRSAVTALLRRHSS